MIIHLIDDDDIINTLHEMVLVDLNPQVQVFCFKSGKQYVDYIESRQFKKPDVAFLDIRMPEMDGIEVIEYLEAQNPNPLENSILFVLSSTLNEKDHKKVLEHKIVKDFLTKPLSVTHIESIILSK